MTDLSTHTLFRKHVNIFITKRFIEIQFYAEYIADPTETVIGHRTAPLNAVDETLGQLLIEGLNESRLLTEEESAQVGPVWSSDYSAWPEPRMKEFGYEDKYEFFEHMNSCFISQYNGRILMSPQHHARLSHWTPKIEADTTNLFFFQNASFSQLGAGLRLALSRCTSETNFDKADIPAKNKPSRLNFLGTSEFGVTYPLIEVYLQEKRNFLKRIFLPKSLPFMGILVNNNQEPLFLFLKSSKNMEFSLHEWKHIQLQAEMLVSSILDYEAQCQQYKRRHKKLNYKDISWFTKAKAFIPHMMSILRRKLIDFL